MNYRMNVTRLNETDICLCVIIMNNITSSSELHRDKARSRRKWALNEKALSKVIGSHRC